MGPLCLGAFSKLGLATICKSSCICKRCICFCIATLQICSNKYLASSAFASVASVFALRLCKFAATSISCKLCICPLLSPISGDGNGPFCPRRSKLIDNPTPADYITSQDHSANHSLLDRISAPTDWMTSEIKLIRNRHPPVYI